MSLLPSKTKKDDKGTWHKVSDVPAGAEIAVPSDTGELMWDKIISITPVGREQVYDIEVEGTHNFVGNDIFAHNTYVLKSGDLTANAPDEVLTADKTGVDLAKLATHTLHDVQDLAAEFAAEDTKLVSLETRVTALETGEIGSESGTPLNFASTSLASAFESFGALIQKGIAQFNTLVFQRLVASSDSNGTSSAASVNILRSSTIAQVSNSLVLPSTKIFVTFNSQIVGSWWVSDKAAGSFNVVLSEAQATDVSFDYFLVQTEGQIMTPDSAAGAEATSGTGTGGSGSGGGSGDASPTISELLQTAKTSANVKVQADYTEASWSLLATALALPETTDAEMTAKTTAINGAVTGLVLTDLTDKIAPVVTLKGDAAMQMATTSTPFADPGATALDDISGDVTASIAVTGSVDTVTEGVYTLTYTAKDATGNIGTVSRVVTVIAAGS